MSQWVLWGIFGVTTLVAAFGVVFFTNPVHSALALVATLLSVSVLFLIQDAFFLSVVQIIVYTGAIVVLFLFVIMLLGVDRSDTAEERLLYHPWFPFAFVVGVAALLVLVILVTGINWPLGQPGSDTQEAINEAGGNVEAISDMLFTRYLLPFEFTSILIVSGIVGAVVLAKRDKKLHGSGIGRSADALPAGDGDPEPDTPAEDEARDAAEAATAATETGEETSS